MKILNLVTLLLVIVGGLNWGLVGAFDFDLVARPQLIHLSRISVRDHRRAVRRTALLPYRTNPCCLRRIRVVRRHPG